jgi:hypothetical protein
MPNGIAYPDFLASFFNNERVPFHPPWYGILQIPTEAIVTSTNMILSPPSKDF